MMMQSFFFYYSPVNIVFLTLGFTKENILKLTQAQILTVSL